jgi:hypothetical protein
MTDNTPDRPDAATPPPPPATPPAPPTAGRPPCRPGKRTLIAAVAAAILLVGGGVIWWALADDDPTSHVEVSGGKLVEGENSLLDDGEECDDSDEYAYNDCDADAAYEFIYKITNEGDEPANYAVIVNGFDEDGEFVGQAYVSATHLAPGKTDADTGEFDEYSNLEDDHSLSDIASVKIAHVERVLLAN